MPLSHYTPEQIEQSVRQKQQQFIAAAKESESLFIDLLLAASAPGKAELGESSSGIAAVDEDKSQDAYLITLTDQELHTTEYLAVVRYSRIDGNKGRGKPRLDIFESNIEAIAGHGAHSVVWRILIAAYQDDANELQFKPVSTRNGEEIRWVTKLFREEEHKAASYEDLDDPIAIDNINQVSKYRAETELASLKAIGVVCKNELIRIRDASGLICYGIVIQDLGAIELFGLIMNYYYGVERVPAYNLTAELAWQLILGCIDAVKSVSDKGWVHRDIKPENILVSFIGGRVQIRLGDFGYASKLEPYDYETNGTIGFVAPEQYIKNYDKPAEYFNKVDVYSLGWVVAFLSANREGVHILFGDRYHEEKPAAEKISFPMRQEFSEKMRASLDELITSMLETDPNKRATINQVYEAAQRINKIWKARQSNVPVEVDMSANVADGECQPAIENSNASIHISKLTQFFQKVLAVEEAYDNAEEEELEAIYGGNVI